VDDWWPIHNAIAGGNDFSETIPLDLIRPALEGSQAHIVVVADQKEYSIYSDVEFAAIEGTSPA
jgi:hypothetical protein